MSRYNNTNKFAHTTAAKTIRVQLELPLFEQECTGVLIDDGFSLEDIVECNTSHFVASYHPSRFRAAVKIICNNCYLQEHQVEDILLNLHVFGANTRKLPVEEIISLWDDYHCEAEVYDDSEPETKLAERTYFDRLI